MEFTLSTKEKRAYRARGLDSLLRMGHCAPAVMKTVLDLNQARREDLIRLMAGMPGGIGNTGFECGGITSPLVLLGLRYGLREMNDGLPRIFDLGHEYYQRFYCANGASFCKAIQNPRLPIGCIQAVRHSPELLAETLENDKRSVLPADQRHAYACLYCHMRERDFHCAQAVFQKLEDILPVNQELLDASSAFIGGTLFKGLTCGAYTAGVMAIGLTLGEIENSYLRVMRMLTLMVTGGNAFKDELNKFNPALNTGYRLSKWFRKEFDSTQCQAITQCDFSTKNGVEKYITEAGVSKCETIAKRVAEQVKLILRSLEESGSLSRPVPSS